MHSHNYHKISFLDKIRYSRGNDALKEFFYAKVNEDKKEAVKFLNDNNLNFATLYSLLDEIFELEFISYMNSRNKLAIELTEEILTGRKSVTTTNYFSSNYIQIFNSALKWMLETGYYDDGLNDDFDEVLDICAVHLVRIYREKAILPILADMIFARHRKGTLAHNLIWAFFESHDPCSLIYLANYLQSHNHEDVKFAQKLLSFIPDLRTKDNLDSQTQYSLFLNWIDENCMFLYCTGESYQETGKPIPYRINLQAKYLHMIVSPDTGKILKPLTNSEYSILDEFIKLDENIKSALSNYSYMLYNKDLKKWKMWIHHPISQQIQFDII